jgi:hypothetical protein
MWHESESLNGRRKRGSSFAGESHKQGPYLPGPDSPSTIEGELKSNILARALVSGIETGKLRRSEECKHFTLRCPLTQNNMDSIKRRLGGGGAAQVGVARGEGKGNADSEMDEAHL